MTQWRGVVGVGAAAMACLVMLAVTTRGFRVLTTDDARADAVAAHPVALPRIALIDMQGEPQTLWVPDRSTIIDFVYTRCPTMCGALGGEYQQLQERVHVRGLADRVRLLTVSFDPTWDTPARLRAYATLMRPNPAIWTLATLPDTALLARMLDAFGVRVIADGANGFTHNAALHVVDRYGQLVAIVPVTAPDDALDAAVIASAVTAVASAARPGAR